MSPDFTIVPEDGYIRIVFPGEDRVTSDNVSARWAVIGEACKKHNCRKILVEAQQIVRQLDTTDIFNAGCALPKMHLHGMRVAFVVPDYDTDSDTEFFETVAKNRGTYISFFKNKEEAFLWLDIDHENPGDIPE